MLLTSVEALKIRSFDRMLKIATDQLAQAIEQETIRRRKLDGSILECLYGNGIVNHKRGDKSWGERLSDVNDAVRIKPRFKGDWAMPTRKSPLTQPGMLATNTGYLVEAECDKKASVYELVNGRRKRVPKKHAKSYTVEPSLRDAAVNGESIHKDANTH